MFRREWDLELSPARQRWGWVFLALYLFVFPRLSGWIQQLLFREGEALIAEVNVVYYLLLFGLLLVIFWTPLREDLAGLRDWLPENLYGVILGLCAGLILRQLLEMVPCPVADPIPVQYAQQYNVAPGATLALILLLIPLVEEIVFRGFLYGVLRQDSRLMAALAVTLLYPVFLVWRYAWDFGDPRYLILAVCYLPMSAALTLCRENGGSVWSCVLLHGGFNGALLLMAL